jgi:hypothetical protein
METIKLHELLRQLLGTELHYRQTIAFQADKKEEVTMSSRRTEVMDRLIHRSQDCMFNGGPEEEKSLTQAINTIAAWSEEEIRDKLTFDLARSLDGRSKVSACDGSQ